MKKLTKIMLTVIAGSAFILGGAQTAPAAPGQGAPARQVQSDRKAERGHQGRTEAPRKYQNSSR
ncbi:hypothetical protein LJB99_03340, partial [Deltaproteobacteria bacterium OttesenSCG-928-K17]|nr:hypothetical protein [Deltaproteobacteria bacterium OttesenSCG-928-K17]